MNFIKFGNLFLPAVLLVGTEIYARVATQGIEQGLLSMIMEWCMSWVAAGQQKLFPGA